MTLPELHLVDWRPTKDTLHLYCQIVGKVRLASTPPRNHWWNAPLYVDVRGLTTRRLHHGDTTFQIDFDFVDHALVVRTYDGRNRSFELADGVSVADFDARLHEVLTELGVDVEIKEQPFGVPMTTPFPQDREHASWDRDAIERYGRVLDWSDRVLEESAAGSTARPAPSISSGTASTSPSPASPAGRHRRSRQTLSPKRPTPERSSRSASGRATTPFRTPPTTPTRLPSRMACAIDRCRSASGSRPGTGRSHSCPTTRFARHGTRAERCSPSCKPPTRQAPGSRAGTQAASSRDGVRPQASFRSFFGILEWSITFA